MKRRLLVASLLTVACDRGILSHDVSSSTRDALRDQAAALTLTALARVEPQAPAQPARALTSDVHAAVGIAKRSAQRLTEPDAAASRCPPEMAFIDRAARAYCIDRWEGSLEHYAVGGARELWPSNQVVDGRESEMIAVSVPGRKPQGYVSGKQAELACHRANKRLCEIDEWVQACRGPERRIYPYGNQRRPDLCNDRFKVLDGHPVVALFEQFAAPGENRANMWTPDWMNDPRLFDLPRTVEPTGSHPDCQSAYGVFDLVGNVHEWTADPEGTFVGGFFMDTFQNGEGCGYRTRAHNFEYHDYSTGFRCCKAAAPE